MAATRLSAAGGVLGRRIAHAGASRARFVEMNRLLDMALIACPVCKRKTSDRSTYCLHCGLRMIQSWRAIALNSALITGALALLVVFARNLP